MTSLQISKQNFKIFNTNLVISILKQNSSFSSKIFSSIFCFWIKKKFSKSKKYENWSSNEIEKKKFTSEEL